MNDYLNIMSTIPLFKSIEVNKWNEFLANNACSVEEFKKGSIIHLQNEQCTAIEVIIYGIVTIQRLDYTGNVMTISDFYSGDVLGSNLLFSTKPLYPMTVSAKENTQILRIRKSIVFELCKENSEFLSMFLNQISDKTLVLTGKINNIVMKSIRECIIDYLLLESKIQNSNTIFLPFTKKEWAERLGIQRPSLSRELNKMKQDGLITLSNRNITIISTKRLQLEVN